MNIVLFDDQSWRNLLPLTFTRPVCQIRLGILTIKEKWEKRLRSTASYLTQSYLNEKYPLIKSKDNLLINGALLPDEEIIKSILKLSQGQILLAGSRIIAASMDMASLEKFKPENVEPFEKLNYSEAVNFVDYPWQIFVQNGNEIESDYALITRNRKSASLSISNNVLRVDNIFLEEGAKVEFATLNSTEGPIYIGNDTEIMEGAIIRGPFALCAHSTVKIGAKIYGPTTVGPHSKVGGEINNSVIFGYSNKAHDGFLGNSVIGEWCNLGADTNNSNLKNNYAEVRLWNYVQEKFIPTGLQFCGLIMGDHSKCGINTMFNTGTIVGVSANIFGSGFPRNFIPSFSWGGAHGFTTYSLPSAFEVATRVMDRRNIDFDETEKNIFRTIFDLTEKYRKF
jgi:UDP-N-acetylglucosamine diphosphorylase/glucosamine-1-phosphate N-acetyltransferase